MAKDKKGDSVGVIRKGQVIKGQGFVPYNGPKEVSTPDVSKGDMRYVKKRGMGAALRDDYFYDC
jgi:hypothetical protein